MYTIIRMLLIMVVFLIISSRVRVKDKRKFFYILSACLVIPVYFGLSLLPFENLFVTFSSPEASYRYVNLSSPKDPLIISGDSCDLLIEREDVTHTYSVIPKTEKGWKIGRGIDLKWGVGNYENGIMVELFRYKDTDDYFVLVETSLGKEMEISADNAEFASETEERKTAADGWTFYYAHMTELGCITVDGVTIDLGDGVQ